MPVGESALDRNSILSTVEQPRAEIYDLVRGLLDDLEEAAPWDQLYCPPEIGIASVASALVGTVDRIPSRIAERTSGLIAENEGAMRESLEEAEFFFFGIHGMVENEISRLRSHLEGGAPAPGTSPGRYDEVSELAADLKGKYTSALVGATATIVGHGRWPGFSIETILFPERDQEFVRTRTLVDALRETLEMIRRLPDELEYAELLSHWRRRQRVDPYALADLSWMRGQLGRLLKSTNRRALYSGDYFQIRRRESRLSARINELESLHQVTWDGPTEDHVFDRLVALSLEIAAILDIDFLERLIGRKVVTKLRAIVVREGHALADPGYELPELPDSLDGLPRLMLDEDLHTFLELLFGSVMKRACLARERPEAEEADREEEGAERPVSEAARPAEVVDAEIRVLEALRSVLTEMQSSRNAHWNQLRMLDRLLKKPTRIPVEMVQSAQPYLEEINQRLLPVLEPAVTIGAIPTWVRPKLLGYCEALSGDVGPEKMARDVPDAMNRILRLLDALSEQTDEELRRRTGV